jgi:hypothetical protein
MNELNDFTVPFLVNKFVEFKNQKLYLLFLDKSGNKHFFLACKRGNSKHMRKIKQKINLIEEKLKKSKYIHKRDKSDIVFLTLTFDRLKFLNNIYAWKFVSHYVNDFIENLKKKLRKRNNDIEFFLKTYEYHKDYFPHVHLILKLKNPLKTFMWKGKKRFALKRKIFEWGYGFTDAFAPHHGDHIIGYLVKYCVKNYFGNYLNFENEQDTNKNKEKINGIYLDKSDILLSILWLFRLFTISHTRLNRLDYNKSELTYDLQIYTFKGLIIINYPIQFLEFIKEWYKIHEVIYFKIHANEKIIEIENDMFSLNKNNVEIDDNHIF